MTRTRFFIRPAEKEAVKWVDCPAYRARRLKEEGFTEVDRSAFEIHLQTHEETTGA